MTDHDVPKNPGSAGVLEYHILCWNERVVEDGDLFVLKNDAVLVDEAFRGAGCAAGIENVEGVGERETGEC